jgi:NAD-dependent deacetylase
MIFPPTLMERLRAARHVAVLTGAGISAESGVPTFRDAQTGLWSRYKPEDLATPEAFQRNPRLVWEWYAWRRECVAKVTPNPGHIALAEMERQVPRFTLITQNVDGLHDRAGSRRVVELHGNITRTKCFEENTIIQNWSDSGEVPPRCPRCGGRLRPDVVWFGETLPAHAFEEALRATQACEVFFSIGTSSMVYPAASLSYEALQSGAVVVEINPEKTPLTTQATHSFRAPSGQLLPLLVKAAWTAERD